MVGKEFWVIDPTAEIVRDFNGVLCLGGNLVFKADWRNLQFDGVDNTVLSWDIAVIVTLFESQNYFTPYIYNP